ncbi:MAG: hypothetical protein JKY34_02515 [Kordiimonadaceae bacterium]|nr:hypothetical protein [Kordiimonadaceae bacterium]
MPTLPDQLINKAAKRTQNCFYGVSGFSGLLGIGVLSNGSAVGFALLALGGLIAWAASKIKTTYNWKGGGGVYK